jgi:hypothetical protein
LRAVEFLGDELAMPGQNGVGLDNSGHFLQRLLAELPAGFSQRPVLAIAQLHTTHDPVPQKAIFRHRVFSAQQQFLINCPRDIREQFLPLREPLHLGLYHPTLTHSINDEVG